MYLYVNTKEFNISGIIYYMSNIGKKLVKRRKALGWSQETLASKAHVSQGTIGHLESGRNQTTRKLPEIAAALGVSVEWLIASQGAEKGANRGTELPPPVVQLEPAVHRILSAIAGLSHHQIEQIAAAIEAIRNTPNVRKKNMEHIYSEEVVRIETPDGRVIDHSPNITRNKRSSSKKAG